MSEKKDQISDEFEIHSFFRVLNQNRDKIWLWQKELVDGKRIVQYGIVKKVDLIKQVVHIAPNSSKGFKFESLDEFFFYHSQKSLAFKFKAREITKEMMIVPIPKSFHKLSSDFLKNVELIEKENEEQFKHLRGAPRVQPQGDQFVSLVRVLPDNSYSKLEIFSLYDISQGGMGFKVEDPSEFDIGEVVEVKNINEKEVPKLMIGEVVSIRQQESERSEFKVGVKFRD
ncbi:PilZ domain-containing protein [Halobacteriovorax sp. HLS]|uniref:PilZ domain-containing protein n=1 Tax=Halobacteriovorax sp. HLS TaxID=2234000 RepID=UPI000FDAA0FE|nr:PilZ domain-containing protein [Halobacteriovorax sp. HLS]